MAQVNHKILIIRFSSLGDILLTTPVITLLRQVWPNSEIDYATKEEFASLLSDNQDINNLFLLKKGQPIKPLTEEIFKKVPQYSIIIDLHNKIRSVMLRKAINRAQDLPAIVIKFTKPYLKRILLTKFNKNTYKERKRITEQYFELIFDNIGNAKEWYGRMLSRKLKKLPTRPTLYTANSTSLKEDTLPLWKNMTHPSPMKPTIAIAFGATWFTKMWPITKYVSLIKKLLQSNESLQIALVGSDSEQSQWLDMIKLSPQMNNKRIFNFMGKLSVIQSNLILSKCDILLTNDSGVMHMGSTQPKLYIIALFLSTVEEFGFYPFAPQESFEVISKSLKCKPCNHKGLKSCPKKHFNCAELITVNEVYLKIISRLPSLT